MKSVFKLLFILLPGLISFRCFSQRYIYTETEIKSADMQSNYIGAELATDKKYWFKTAEGLDSVLLSSYSIYGLGIKRTVLLDPEEWIEGEKLCVFIKPPYFKGTLSEGNMQEGELYFETPFYNNIHLYTGAFANNKANGLGIYKISSKSNNLSSIELECKAYFDNGIISERGMLKLDYDSTENPTLYYSGGIMLVDGKKIGMNGTGSFYRVDYVRPYRNFYKPVLNKSYGLGVPYAYYEGQIFGNVRTGFGIYNNYNYNTKKASNLKVGLIAADYPVNKFSEIPINIQTPGKVNIKHEGLIRLLPQISNATDTTFMYINGRYYHGKQYNKKPYGFGYMIDPDGFYEIGFWKDGIRINTVELLKYLLPDSALLTAHNVESKYIRITQKYNSKKNKYIDVKEDLSGNIVYYGKLNPDGKIEGWGLRCGRFGTEVGYFLPTKLESNIRAEMPEASAIFSTCYALKYGNGAGSGYGVQWAKNRFFTSSGFYAEKVVPYGGILLANRDTNTIALCEYRDKRSYEVIGWEEYTARETAKNKKEQEEKERAFNAKFLRINSPTKKDIEDCIGNYYTDRSATTIFRVLKSDSYRKTINVEFYILSDGSEKLYTTFSFADFFSSGEFREVNVRICGRCNGEGTYTISNSYTADYEYTFGKKITYKSSKTYNCDCRNGLIFSLE